MTTSTGTTWRERGVQVVPGSTLDLNTPQTAGMTRAAAITHARNGANKLWAGTVTIHPHAKTGAHHHGDLESVIYVVSGRARMRWGDHLSTWRRRDLGISFMSPRLCRIRKSTPARTMNSSVCWCAAGRTLLSSISTLPLWSQPETVHWVDAMHPLPAIGQGLTNGIECYAMILPLHHLRRHGHALDPHGTRPPHHFYGG